MYRIHGLTKNYDPNSPQHGMAFYSPEDRATIDAAFQKAVAHGEPYDLELRMITAQGEANYSQAVFEEGFIDSCP